MDENLNTNKTPLLPTVTAQADAPKKHNFIKIFIIILLFVFVFNLGISVGREMERFVCNWTASYHKNFGGPQSGFIDAWRNQPPNMINSRGVVGKIIQINNDNLVIQSQSNKEMVIVINTDTLITKSKDKIDKEALKIDDFLVVIGSPETNGQITAKLIRVLP